MKKVFLFAFVFLRSRLAFLPDPARGISLHSVLPFDHSDPGEENSAGSVVHASPPHLLPLPPLSVSLFMVGIATGVRLVRDGSVVSLSFSSLPTPSLCLCLYALLTLRLQAVGALRWYFNRLMLFYETGSLQAFNLVLLNPNATNP